MYNAITHGISVTVTPHFIEDQSDPDEPHYVWAYQVVIENTGDETVQLRSRYWKITDAVGQLQEVRGAGVVGEQPTLAPGESFEYTSGVPLATPSGIMSGAYTMEVAPGEVSPGEVAPGESDPSDSFEVEVPAFSLDSPYESVSLN